MQSSLDISLSPEDSNIVIIRNETRMTLREFLNVAGEVYHFANRSIPVNVTHKLLTTAREEPTPDLPTGLL